MKKSFIKRAVVVFLCVVLLIFILGSFFTIMYMLHDNFDRADIPAYSGFYTYNDYADKYDRETVRFDSQGNILTGYIYGEGDKGLVVISHGLGGYSDCYLSTVIYFVDHGYKVFGFDNTGSGKSEGEGTMGMAQSAIDLDAALTFAESDSRLKNIPILLYGHSWGGYAVAAVLASDHDVTAAVSISGYNTPVDIVTETAEGMIGTPLTYIEYPFIWLNNKLTFGDKSDISAVDGINSTNTPVLIIHGVDDERIQFDGASIISHKDEITNPNVEYKAMEGKRHSDIYLDDSVADYFYKKDRELTELTEKYDGDVPLDVQRTYYENVDKSKTSKLSEDFMDDVQDFYMKALEAKG